MFDPTYVLILTSLVFCTILKELILRHVHFTFLNINSLTYLYCELYCLFFLFGNTYFYVILSSPDLYLSSYSSS